MNNNMPHDAELRQKNWRELYNSIRNNIQDATKELSLVYKKREEALKLVEELASDAEVLSNHIKDMSEKKHSLELDLDKLETKSRELRDIILNQEKTVDTNNEEINRGNEALVGFKTGLRKFENDLKTKEKDILIREMRHKKRLQEFKNN